MSRTEPVAVPAPEAADFAALTDPYRRELTVHCYRILGSFEDAEDALQEALLRAWRQLGTLQSRAALRAWLYRIATNVALNMLAARKARGLPPALVPAADPRAPLPAASPEALWLEPLPDEYLAGFAPGPEARLEAKESITLAFLTVLQRLPARQRAVLILRDVLGWRADEVAEILTASVPAVNSALQRARATLKQAPGAVAAPAAADPALLAEFVAAWETADAPRLTALLREDAVFSMPPLAAWFQGRAAIATFLREQIFQPGLAGPQFRTRPTRANGGPALASYQRDAAGIYRPGALIVLTVAGPRIAEIHDFLAANDRLFARFGMPPQLG